MIVKVLQIRSRSFIMESMEKIFLEAVAKLQAGEPVAFPTETVYGLGAPVFQESAVQKVFLIKGRPSDNPLIVHISHLDEVKRLAIDIPDAFYVLAEKFMPGPLTIVLKRHPNVPPIVSAGHPSIAIRMPSHPLALRLIEAVGEPLVAPSANLSGRPSPTNAADVLEDLEGKVSLVLDGGECSVGIESTVISLFGPKPVLLRPGAISREELELALREAVLEPSVEEPAHSPGMLHRHYAPRAKIHLLFEKEAIGNPEFLLSSEPHLATHFTRRNFYSFLRKADRLGVEEITIYCGPTALKDPGLMNRVLRAAGKL